MDSPRIPHPRQSQAGDSAQREYERRANRWEASVRAEHRLLGGLILAFSGPPTSTRVWAQGAAGERAVGAVLDSIGEAVVLHDRRMRRPDGRLSQANIDHLVIVPTGVWVVDAKTHKGRLHVRRSGGWLSTQTEELFINGRSQTRLVDGIERQVEAVVRELGDPNVPVRGALCFVGTELPRGESIRTVPLVGRRELSRILKKPGALGTVAREQIASRLGERFPA